MLSCSKNPGLATSALTMNVNQLKQKYEKHRTVNNSSFIQFLPHPKEKPDIVCYICKHYQGWNVTHRADIITHPSIIALQFSSGPYSMLVINLYNPADNSVTPLLSTLKLPNIPTIITGDFNLHHPNWSSSDKQVMTTSHWGQGGLETNKNILSTLQALVECTHHLPADNRLGTFQMFLQVPG